ncbi:helix-turn-helix domain-containing protein [Paenibacillus camerounensis]|uniref:helix-turn-helix domain-containing protein n=1 Tax=Paenibacillus camerounensis TaxID=1243663 RepID=UPI0006945969|nr:AraC family transcriptional regulator [Paenibacillus camerounensis]
MMKLYGAEHHLLVLSDAIDADEHAHSFVQVTFALGGEMDIDLDGSTIHCKGIVMDSNVLHRLNGTGKPLMLLLIDGTSDIAAGFRQQIDGRGYSILQPELVDTITAFALEQSSEITDSSSYSLFFRQLMKLFRLDHVQTGVTDTRIRDLITLIRDCRDSEHSVGEYASQLGLSGSRLSHLFKDNTGTSLSGYIVLHKLQKAVYLIFNGAPITEAAMEAGFDSPSHFAATSKRMLGMAAREIRKDSVFLKVSTLQ